MSPILHLRGLPGCAALALLTWGATGQAGPVPANELIQGRTLYESRCGGCHAVDANRVGPMHRNLIARAAIQRCGVVGQDPGRLAEQP